MRDGTGPDRFCTVASGLRICLRVHGDERDPAMLLVAGLGEDLTAWSDPFVDALVGHGFRAVVMDNRDVGRSSFVSRPAPPLWRQLASRPRSDAYTLEDMAGDAVGVLDHLGVDQAHLVGRSMGGMIAQTIAAAVPGRTSSLTSIYSTTGAKDVGQPALSTLALLAARPPRSRTAAVRAHLRLTQHVAGRAHPIDDETEARLAARAWDRSAGDQAAGIARQIQAIQSSGDRTERLRRITAPTLVIHGDHDRMVAPTGGDATAAAIRDAQHVVVPGMGHHLHDDLTMPITHHISEHAHRASRGGSHVRTH